MALSSFLPWSLSLSRHHTGVGPGKNPKIQQGCEERIFYPLSHPPPHFLSRRISIEISFWFVYAFSDLEGIGVQGLQPPPPFCRKILPIRVFEPYLISIYSTPPFLHRNRCCDPPPPPNAFYNNKKNLDLNIHFIDHLFLKVVETRFPELAVSLLDFSPRIPLDTFSILLHNKDYNVMHFLIIMYIPRTY